MQRRIVEQHAEIFLNLTNQSTFTLNTAINEATEVDGGITESNETEKVDGVETT